VPVPPATQVDSPRHRIRVAQRLDLHALPVYLANDAQSGGHEERPAEAGQWL
jgi:hypothetical protein